VTFHDRPHIANTQTVRWNIGRQNDILVQFARHTITPGTLQSVDAHPGRSADFDGVIVEDEKLIGPER